MFRLVALFLVCALLMFAPYQVALGDDFPWTTFSEAAKYTVGTQPGGCDGNQILVAKLEYNGTRWAYFYSDDTKVFVFAQMGTDGVPVRIYSGTAQPLTHDAIVITESHAPRVDETGPCPTLFPNRV